MQPGLRLFNYHGYHFQLLARGPFSMQCCRCSESDCGVAAAAEGLSREAYGGFTLIRDKYSK